MMQMAGLMTQINSPNCIPEGKTKIKSLPALRQEYYHLRYITTRLVTAKHVKVKLKTSIEWCGVPRLCNNQYGKCPSQTAHLAAHGQPIPYLTLVWMWQCTPTHGDASIRLVLVWIGAAVAEIWLLQNTVSIHKRDAHLAAHGQPIPCPTLE